jgi:hypothetical protein
LRSAKAGPCKEIPGSPHFRSSWERNFYRVLLRIYPKDRIEYEPQRYTFKKPYRRVLDYCPDFIIDRGLPTQKIYEVKGWLDGPSRTRLLGFQKNYPDAAARLIIVTSGQLNQDWVQDHFGAGAYWDYAQIKRECSGVVAWE